MPMLYPSSRRMLVRRRIHLVKRNEKPTASSAEVACWRVHVAVYFGLFLLRTLVYPARLISAQERAIFLCGSGVFVFSIFDSQVDPIDLRPACCCAHTTRRARDRSLSCTVSVAAPSRAGAGGRRSRPAWLAGKEPQRVPPAWECDGVTTKGSMAPKGRWPAPPPRGSERGRRGSGQSHTTTRYQGVFCDHERN